MAALTAVLGTSLLLCAVALAETPETVTFTSSPPSPALVGGSYAVSATSSSGAPVTLWVTGCWLEPAPSEYGLGGGDLPVPSRAEMGRSPLTVYLDGTGACHIEAISTGQPFGPAARAVQTFTVARNPSEEVTFVSTPMDAVVGGSYSPRVRSSPGVESLQFYYLTPSVCNYEVRETAPLSGGTVLFFGQGTCRIAVRETGAPEAETLAEQSFTVALPPNTFTPPANGGATEPNVQAPPANDDETPATPTNEKGLSRGTKLKKALKACARDKSERKRRRCQASARREYGPATSSHKHGAGAAPHADAPFRPLGPIRWARAPF